MSEDQYKIPDETNLPEITVKAVILGAVLSIVLAAANAYLGLFAGMTVSASIPAAVVSMAILRFFKNSNVLENNIVQTAASAGESLAAGVIFTLPALIILKYWTTFSYIETTIIAALGGIIGVLFTVPLRRALIVQEKLKFPEGIATAEVLHTGQTGGGGIKHIASAGIVGGLFKLGTTGLGLWSGSAVWATKVRASALYIGSDLSPALVSVGYIVGINIAVLIFLGGAINFLIAIPLYGLVSSWPLEALGGLSAEDRAMTIWSKKTRYLGVGAMVVGGLWALIQLRGPIVTAVKSSLGNYGAGSDSSAEVPRTERDTPMKFVITALLFSLIPICGLYFYIIKSAAPSIIMSIVMLIAGFLFSAVAAYMAGLVGSSNNPISGITIATILFTAILLSFMMGTEDALKGAAAAIFVGGVVCCAAAIGGDNMQDLKAGYLLGATPWKQQVMQVIGVLAAAFTLAPVLQALDNAYKIGSKDLPAPQAGLMASVAKGVFAGGLPWLLVGIGAAIAVVIIILDKIQEARGSEFRLPVLAVAVGIYLPFELSVPIIIGGLVSWFTQRGINKEIKEAQGEEKQNLEKTRKEYNTNGVLFASGLITGEALMAIAMAIPIGIYSSKTAIMDIVNNNIVAPIMGNQYILGSYGSLPGIALLTIVVLWLAAVAIPKRK